MVGSLVFVCLLWFSVSSLSAQGPGSGGRGGRSGPIPTTTLTVGVRDSGGMPLEVPALVKLRGALENGSRVASTQEAASAVFEGVTEGEYEIEAQCVGYQTVIERVSVATVSPSMQVYVYLPREGEKNSQFQRQQGIAVSPKLQAEIEKGLDALRKRQFEAARNHLAKGAQLAAGNPDVIYLLGVSELGLNHPDLARQNFEHALSLDPGHERALLALGEIQLRAGEFPAAIVTLEKAFAKNGAGWRTHLLLASAYSKVGRLPDAETHARRAADLAHEKGAGARLLLGEIQRMEGKLAEAQHTWEELVAKFPNESFAAEAKQKLASLSSAPRSAASPDPAQLANLPVPVSPSIELMPASERPWAPPDIDSREYPLAQNANCSAEEILPLAEHRLKSQLRNFEKFTATEHIDHQEIDRLGRPGPVKSRDFSYIVFVNPYAGDSFFLDEDRYSTGRDSSFPTSLATEGLNNLGVAILQPVTRKDFVYQCEGLAGIRGKASWQIRFQERNDSRGGVRDWRRDGKIYHLALKGRIWISSSSYDVLRVETDLLQPVEILGLTRDHLLVDYGPVTFASSNTTLWLPWSAEMHMELHGHRYHHKHYLTDYMLFEVDTNHKIGKPKNAPPPSTQDSPATDPTSPDNSPGCGTVRCLDDPSSPAYCIRTLSFALRSSWSEVGRACSHSPEGS
jgi:tetratricopeptide (TPR) repeat protein